MGFTRVLTGAAGVISLLTGLAAAEAQAQDGLYVPLLTYRTGPFAGSGIPIANGMRDYLTLLNERDGGIGGVKIVIEECETGYDTQKGVECYESTKGKGALMYNPYSTGITLQLIPKASVDGIPVLSMAYGLSASADGTVFPWIFNPPDTYWDGASAIIKHIADMEGGLDKLNGKTIGYIFLDAGYGREPIPLLEQLAEKYGYTLQQYPVPAQQMQNQSSIWLNVRRDRPDWIYLQGWGAMNPTAIQEAAQIRFPMDHMIGIWWSAGDDDARPAGEGAIGYKTVNINATGTDFPAVQDILTHVVEKGLSQVDSREKVGENLYNRGVMNSVLIAEAIRTAQELTGETMVTAADVRRGLENLEITEERLKEIGLEGFMAPIKVTCEDHSGHHPIFVQQWDGAKWQPVTDPFEPMTDVVQPLLEAAAEEYVAANQPWPKREAPCE
jgi:branched-chain amino acid transport system substrate-binding protein